MNEKLPDTHGLKRELKNRHIQLIAIGGAIGTGLFYGSASTIQTAGPGILLSYAIVGLLVIFVLRALGEMTVEDPAPGSFSYYAYKYLGDYAGFFTGWNYWFNYTICNIAELTVMGIYIQFWFPGVPLWATAIAVMAIFGTVNLMNVKAFGEFEFWFALIKVVTIVSMIFFGLFIIVFGLGEGQGITIANLWANGGFLPFGGKGLLLSLAVVTFAFGGVEMAGLAAAETKDPVKQIPKAIKSIGWRLAIFYLGAIFIILVMQPWDQIGMGQSPFVQVFSLIGLASAASIMNAVILTATLSGFNSAIYSQGRMLHGLAVQGNAPKIFARVPKNGSPVAGILVTIGTTAIGVAWMFVYPSDLFFIYILSIAALSGMVNWMMILLAQYKARKAMDAEAVAKLRFKMPGYPYTTIITFICFVIIMLAMLYVPENRVSFYIYPVFIAITLILYKVFAKKKINQKEDINEEKIS